MLIEFCSELENHNLLRMRKTMKALDRLRAERANEEGFTLIELLIVMSVMLILMTLAVPQMLKLTKTAHETSAMQSVRTIGQAELQYNSAYPALGFSCSLATLGGDPKSGAPSAQSSQLLSPDLASGQKAGYTFAITNCTKVNVNNQDMVTGYEVTAVPNSIGRTGDRGFCSDENNTIRFDPAGGTNCTQPIQ
jgi:type IV pilus assembly protein PilA